MKQKVLRNFFMVLMSMKKWKKEMWYHFSLNLTSTKNEMKSTHNLFHHLDEHEKVTKQTWSHFS